MESFSLMYEVQGMHEVCMARVNQQQSAHHEGWWWVEGKNTLIHIPSCTMVAQGRVGYLCCWFTLHQTNKQALNYVLTPNHHVHASMYLVITYGHPYLYGTIFYLQDSL